MSSSRLGKAQAESGKTNGFVAVPPGAARLVAGIGASAGGLEAFRKLLTGISDPGGLALLLVQHLDPEHKSLLADLLATHTTFKIHEAENSQVIEAGRAYVIPPGYFMTVSGGCILLTPPDVGQAVRHPIDRLFSSLAQDYGAKAIGVVLSGTGDDGSAGTSAIRTGGGHTLAQDPSEAGSPEMPNNAIATGNSEQTLPATDIARWLNRQQQALKPVSPERASDQPQSGSAIAEIIEELKTVTGHEFAGYKRGTIERRVHRRMAILGFSQRNTNAYLLRLRESEPEVHALAKDLLIHVTRFFRDADVFDMLERIHIPQLLRDHPPDKPLRIWVAGCSTGEEAYSLAILFQDVAAALELTQKVQIFATDLDPDSIATAREGYYPASIKADISAERLAANFIKSPDGYRIHPEIKARIVFSVQDVLLDPPFSRLDMVSCRNLLIYLQAEAQRDVIDLFHFALRTGGLLVLGNSEAIPANDARFVPVAKGERIFRRAGIPVVHPSVVPRAISAKLRTPVRLDRNAVLARPAALAAHCERVVLQALAPASILINNSLNALYFLGPTERFLSVQTGFPSSDILNLARDEIRSKLRTVIQSAMSSKAESSISGVRLKDAAEDESIRISVMPTVLDAEDLYLVSFLAERRPEAVKAEPAGKQAQSHVNALKNELQETRSELQAVIRDLETASEDQKAINEEALSINEEYQSANEELLTSKEELQALNEELTALNTQLQETLEQQRVTSNDLQNVLYSTDVPTLFLDTELRIRLFTPAIRTLFNIIPGDIGRPLADLRALSADSTLTLDAAAVLKSKAAADREIEGVGGRWFIRGMHPYRTQDDKIEGVVVTFVDTTEKKITRKALEAAKNEAEMANTAKSRFLAAASHDLRQPLQTLILLQELLGRQVTSEKGQKLIQRGDQALAGMSGMLNSLLDINQIEAGTVGAHLALMPVDDLFRKLGEEFSYLAVAKRLTLRVVHSSLIIYSDARLLEQMIRNLLSNAIKYTVRGKILLGCRRRKGKISIEIWDTGSGIPGNQLMAIFEEYHQLENNTRDPSRGLGLGLAIVQQLAGLMGHEVHVRSKVGRGSTFAIEVLLAKSAVLPFDTLPVLAAKAAAASGPTGAILVIDDDRDVRELLVALLEDEGHTIESAADGPAALELVRSGFTPDFVIADYNLPLGMDGLETVEKLRTQLRTSVPVAILTGDITTETLRRIAKGDCIQLNKPMKPKEMMLVIRRVFALKADRPALLPPLEVRADAIGESSRIAIVDDDAQLCDVLRTMLELEGYSIASFPDCESFLKTHQPGDSACLLLDANLPGMSGLQLLQHLKTNGDVLPVIMITGNSQVPLAVEAMKGGALDFIEKPVGRSDLLRVIRDALVSAADSNSLIRQRDDAASHLSGLTARQHEIMQMVLAGHPNKNIAADLGISQRTVENHRASIMKRTGSKSLPALARLAVAAAR